MAKKLYECRNKACSLGTPHQPGRFTGGMTSGFAFALTGINPVDQKKGVHYGEGICPNCGEKGKEI